MRCVTTQSRNTILLSTFQQSVGVQPNLTRLTDCLAQVLARGAERADCRSMGCGPSNARNLALLRHLIYMNRLAAGPGAIDGARMAGAASGGTRNRLGTGAAEKVPQPDQPAGVNAIILHSTEPRSRRINLPAPSFRRGGPLTVHQHRKLAVREYLVGFTADQQPGNSAAAMGCHENQVALVRLRGLDDR